MERVQRLMVRFECSQCGKCCRSIGSTITIERAFDDHRFYCKFQVTGEYFVATVAGEYKTLFADSSKGDSSACPFLRKTSEKDRSICAIYPTRPSFCRAFRCSHADILDFMGTKIGKVGGKRSLLSRDPTLIALWEQQVVPLRETDDFQWKEQVKFLLEREGYQVILYE